MLLAVPFVTACSADTMLAPRIDPIVHIDGPVILPSSFLYDVDGKRIAYPRDSLRLNDINPSEIESITIYKGVAASQLYRGSTCTAVIVITTKHAARSAQR